MTAGSIFWLNLQLREDNYASRQRRVLIFMVRARGCFGWEDAAEQRLEPRGIGEGKVGSPRKREDRGCLHCADGIQTPPEPAEIYACPLLRIYPARDTDPSSINLLPFSRRLLHLLRFHSRLSIPGAFRASLTDWRLNE